MADPDFEKQVQQKMEELKFTPSETVWKNIDAEINKERKRRPLFWLFFFLGLSVAGIVYYTSANHNNKSIATIDANKRATFSTTQNKKEVAVTAINKSSESIDSTEYSNKLKINKNVNAINHSLVTINKKNKIRTKTINKIESKKNKELNFSSNINKEKNNNREIIINKNKTSASKISSNKNEKNNDVLNDNIESVNKKETSINQSNNSTDSVKDKIEKIDSIKNKNAIAANEKVITKDSSINKAVAKKDKKTKQNSLIKFGITAGAGFSGINSSLFKSALVAYPALNNTTPVTGNSASAIHNGFSFNAGFFMQKNLSKRVSLSVGINYHYYSTTIKTGKYLDSSSFVYVPNANATSVNGYYANGNANTYTNHYHTIEIPLLINFQLNKNKNLPINWEAGITGLHLINTNALQFDNATGIYYKNNNLFNKTQASAATALTIGFPFNGNILHIGPQLQYSFTNLQNKNTGNYQHLFFTGIKISTTFGKK